MTHEQMMTWAVGTASAQDPRQQAVRIPESMVSANTQFKIHPQSLLFTSGV
jgi:hypothetical protein